VYCEGSTVSTVFVDDMHTFVWEDLAGNFVQERHDCSCRGGWGWVAEYDKKSSLARVERLSSVEIQFPLSFPHDPFPTTDKCVV